MRSFRHSSHLCLSGSARKPSVASVQPMPKKIAAVSSASASAFRSTFYAQGLKVTLTASAVLAMIAAALIALLAFGCARTVLVSEDSPIRTGPDLHARVYTLTSDGEWRLSDNAVTIPEGWYCVPPSFVRDK